MGRAVVPEPLGMPFAVVGNKHSHVALVGINRHVLGELVHGAKRLSVLQYVVIGLSGKASIRAPPFLNNGVSDSAN